MSDKFEGFTAPTKNYFHMPNNWTDITSQIDNLAELKVVEYVLRHTWGFKEYGVTKTISVDEFMYGRRRQDGGRIDKGTGLKSDRSVKDGLKLAIKHGYLICEIDTSDLARTKKSYGLNMIDTGVDTTPPVEVTPVVSTPQTGSIYPSEGYNLPPRQVVSTPRSEKDTSRNTPKKETSERNLLPPPKPPTKPARTERPNVTVIKPQLTLEGQAVLGWYEQIRGRKQRLTDKNIAAANNLALIDGMTLENLKAVIETLDKTPFVLEKNLTVDLVNLERENYYYNFEKTLLIVERNRKPTRASSKPKEQDERYQKFVAAQKQMKATGTEGK